MNKIILGSIIRIGKRLYSPKYLIITNSVTGIISVSIGDSIQQFIEFKVENQLKQNDDQKQFELNKRRNCQLFSVKTIIDYFFYNKISEYDVRRYLFRSFRSRLVYISGQTLSRTQ